MPVTIPGQGMIASPKYTKYKTNVLYLISIDGGDPELLYDNLLPEDSQNLAFAEIIGDYMYYSI